MRSFTLLLTILSITAANALHAQTADSSDTKAAASHLQLSGAVDIYYGYDLSEPLDLNRLYTTQAYRHNEFNLNWGFLRADYSTGSVRAALAVQTGTYVQVNYAAEPNELTQLIAQANAGVRLAEGLWLDAGILPSHIGYESPFSGDNEIYTRALMAENSPYYETGAQLTAEVSSSITLKFLVLNGWQNIRETNSAKSLGIGIRYAPTEQLVLSYSNYYGNEAPDGFEAKRRFFNNLNASYSFSERLTVAGSADYGRQELFTSNGKGSWYAAMLIGRYRLGNHFALAGRIEHYNDEDEIIVTTDTPNGFQTSSASLNFDYIPAPGFLWRLEVRGYNASDSIFYGKDDVQTSNLLLVTSFSINL